ncbi:cytochrome c biogenesis protein ResB [Candidatus Magnetomonas plexicatena]|uniref:cytochrome c biogenesis protein ResB n=1 Tax=Candidatus Magnetomonas plexicatena TaxID=2552947 RepID=UPI001C76E56D|nr:cytochrome c biogenesis protein ResB [Nitrospirales bacterium LBB_01]
MEKSAKKSGSVVDKVWELFSSVKLAAVLILTIAITSIAGTVIEQQAEPAKNVKLFVKIFGDKLAPSIYDASVALGLMDMYHSWWFTGLLILFCTNLIICSIDRLPKIARLVNEELKPMEEPAFKKFTINKEYNLQRSTKDATSQILKTVKSLGFNPKEQKTSEGLQFYGQKWGFSRYAVYVVHISIVLILLGAVIGMKFGFSGYLSLPEGESSQVAYSRDGKAQPLGFLIGCDDFTVNFYNDTDMPKEYMSWLSIYENNKEVMSQSIEVNRPLKYKGFTFYQASYGPLPDKDALIILKVTPVGGKTEIMSLHTGDYFKIPGTGIEGKAVYFSTALAFDKETKEPYTYSKMLNNPAVFIEFKKDGKDLFEGWVAKRYPKTWNLPDNNTVQLVDYWGYQYTGLQVRKDPGVWVVYLGCLTMLLGLYGAFFMSHKKLWVLVKDNKSNTHVIVAATTNKNRLSFEGDIYKAFEMLTGKR